jgi:hypothetical protein
VGYIDTSIRRRIDDAESDVFNRLRIKGDSRLGLDEARLAMRSAWERMASEGGRAATPAFPL